MSDHATRADHGVISHGCTRRNHRAAANPHILTDLDRRPNSALVWRTDGSRRWSAVYIWTAGSICVRAPTVTATTSRTTWPRPPVVWPFPSIGMGVRSQHSSYRQVPPRSISPIPTVGRPRPVTPLTNPASKNAAATTTGWMIGLGMPIQLAPGSNLRNEPFRNPAFACNIGRMVVRRGFVPCISI